MVPAPELTGVEKRFGRVAALNGLTLTLPAGRVVGVMGPNGSGKSTILNLIAGVQRPTRGQVAVFEQALGVASKQRTAYVPTGETTHSWMRVTDLMAYRAAVFPDFDRAKAEAMAASAHLEPGRFVSDLSTGQRARLELALAFARQASLYLLDEPLANVDPASRRYLLDLILREFRPGETTVVITTHHIAEVEELLDYVVILNGGRVALEGEADTLRSQSGRSLRALVEEVSA